jgi:hypothetical protein
MKLSALIAESIGLVAFATNVWANILIARKSESGWIVRLVSNAFWLTFGVAAMSLANALNAVTFAGINVYGLLRWRKERLVRQTSCDDHYKTLCRWCRTIVRQCRCCPGSDKSTTTDGVCGTCASMLPVPASEVWITSSEYLTQYNARMSLAIDRMGITHAVRVWRSEPAEVRWYADCEVQHGCDGLTLVSASSDCDVTCMSCIARGADL